MKNCILFCCALLCGLTVQSQTLDTLGYSNFYNGTPTLYTSPNGGYAFGTNGYGDLVKAQSFVPQAEAVLTKVLVQFGAVNYTSANPDSEVIVNVYDNYGQGVVVGSGIPQDSVAPDSILASIAVPLSQLTDDGSLSLFDFTQEALTFTSSFSVGLDLSALAPGDSVGLMSTTDGDANGSNLAWELTEDSVWFQVAQPQYSWGLDVELAIFAEVQYQTAPSSIEENTIEVAMYPNPSSDYLSIQFKAPKQHHIRVLDAMGRIVQSTTTTQAKHTLQVSQWPSGLYVLCISDNQSSASYTFIKE